MKNIFYKIAVVIMALGIWYGAGGCKGPGQIPIPDNTTTTSLIDAYILPNTRATLYGVVPQDFTLTSVDVFVTDPVTGLETQKGTITGLTPGGTFTYIIPGLWPQTRYTVVLKAPLVTGTQASEIEAGGAASNTIICDTTLTTLNEIDQTVAMTENLPLIGISSTSGTLGGQEFVAFGGSTGGTAAEVVVEINNGEFPTPLEVTEMAGEAADDTGFSNQIISADPWLFVASNRFSTGNCPNCGRLLIYNTFGSTPADAFQEFTGNGQDQYFANNISYSTAEDTPVIIVGAPGYSNANPPCNGGQKCGAVKILTYDPTLEIWLDWGFVLTSFGSPDDRLGNALVTGNFGGAATGIDLAYTRSINVGAAGCQQYYIVLDSAGGGGEELFTTVDPFCSPAGQGMLSFMRPIPGDPNGDGYDDFFVANDRFYADGTSVWEIRLFSGLSSGNVEPYFILTSAELGTTDDFGAMAIYQDINYDGENELFISTSQRTYVVDLASGEIVRSWSYELSSFGQVWMDFNGDQYLDLAGVAIDLFTIALGTGRMFNAL